MVGGQATTNGTRSCCRYQVTTRCMVSAVDPNSATPRPSSVSPSGEHRTKGTPAIPGGVPGSRRFRGQLFPWGMGEPASAGTDFAEGGSNPGEGEPGRGHLAAKSSGPEMGTPGE